MRRIALILGVAVLALLMATPASALTADQLDMTGSMRVRYKINATPGMTDVVGAAGESTDAFFDQRFRLQTRFRPTDFLSVTLRFDALERIWGTPAETVSGSGINDPMGAGNISDSNNVDFEYAYMSVTTSYGKFDIGRMSALAWGTSF
ncbi:MAG: hypothetical protein JRI97_07160, partial [Deltaproteobacteria bacterium]|nr:hypothetical protein [Deltaproteobacteria bacterium]